MSRAELRDPGHDNALDWVRAAAALSVLAHHVTPLVAGYSLLPHAYLAVDLFFLLSGYVVAKRYQPRLAQGMRPGMFFAARAQRLAPLLLLAGTLCTLEVSMRRSFGSTLADTPGWKIAASVVASWFALPSASAQALGHGNWPLDPPLWSLFFELLVGVLAAPWLLRARSSSLACVVGLCALWLLRRALYAGDLDAGVFLYDFPAALARMAFSFCVGVLVLRRCAASRAHAIAPLAALAFASLLGAFLACVEATHGARDPYVVMVLWPAVLYALVSRPSALRLPPATWLGEMSYAIYVLHWPLLSLLRNLARRTHLMGADDWLSTFALVAAVLAASAAAVMLYERPFRAHLRAANVASAWPSSGWGRR